MANVFSIRPIRKRIDIYYSSNTILHNMSDKDTKNENPQGESGKNENEPIAPSVDLTNTVQKGDEPRRN
jgi:hypothetical protein